MDYSVLSLVVILCATVAALSVAAQRLRVAAPILMLVAGAAIAFVPGIPQVALDPELVLVLLLPPLLYSSGVGMSWRGFRSNLRPILLLAIGCVLFTAGAVAAVTHYRVAARCGGADGDPALDAAAAANRHGARRRKPRQ